MKLLNIISCLLFVVCITTVSTSYAISASSEIKINDTIMYAVNVDFENNQYTIELTNLKYSINETIVVSKFNSSVFKSFVVNSVKVNLKKTELDELLDRALLIFLELQTILYNEPDVGQKIALLEVADSVNIYNEDTSKCKVLDCQIVFEDGFIKSILVGCKVDKKMIYYSNMYGIGITTRTNIQKLEKIKLWNEHSTSTNDGHIKVGEALTYKRLLGLKTNDYSPKDGIINMFGGESKHLYKEKSSELFQLNIYTDFVGINANNPNGLVQTEISKRINFNTNRIGWRYVRAGVGVLTHLTPTIQISKIEDNNRYLGLSNGNINDTTSLYYLSPIQVLRYSTAKVGSNFNILDIQGSAMSFHLDYILGFSLTLVRDSINISNTDSVPDMDFVDEQVGSMANGIRSSLIFNPSSLWEFKLSHSIYHYNAFNRNFDYYSPSDNYLVKGNEFISTFKFLLTWQTSSGNKIFGRVQINHELNDAMNNYSQFQVGYSIFLKTASK